MKVSKAKLSWLTTFQRIHTKVELQSRNIADGCSRTHFPQPLSTRAQLCVYLRPQAGGRARVHTRTHSSVPRRAVSSWNISVMPDFLKRIKTKWHFDTNPQKQNPNGLHTRNPTQRMVCYTNSSGKLSMETVGKRAGRWLDDPRVYQCLGCVSANQINEPNDFAAQKQMSNI